MEKLGIETINSQACEQAFKWLNRFKNMKKMNQCCFKFFFLYMVDMHNLHIEKKVDSIANPLSKERLENISLNNINKERIQTQMTDMSPTIASDHLDTSNIEYNEEKIENCYSEINGKYKCNFCNAIYQKKGQLKNHLESKHAIKVDLGCLCGKVFSEFKKLERHRKTCNK